MKFYLQYDLVTGVIYGAGWGDQDPSLPTGRGFLSFSEGIEDTGKIVDVTNKVLIDDPVYIKNKNNNEIYRQLADIDQKRMRAYFEDYLLKGDNTWLQTYATQAAALRAKIQP